LSIDCYWIGQGKTGDWYDPANWLKRQVADSTADVAIFGAKATKGFPTFKNPVLPGGQPPLAIAGLKMDETFAKGVLNLDVELTVIDTLQIDGGTIRGSALRLAHAGAAGVAPKWVWDGGSIANLVVEDSTLTLGSAVQTYPPMAVTERLFVSPTVAANWVGRDIALAKDAMIVNRGNFTIDNPTKIPGTMSLIPLGPVSPDEATFFNRGALQVTATGKQPLTVNIGVGFKDTAVVRGVTVRVTVAKGNTVSFTGPTVEKDVIYNCDGAKLSYAGTYTHVFQTVQYNDGTIFWAGKIEVENSLELVSDTLNLAFAIVENYGTIR
jgi:hypothetical protein